MTTVTAVKLSAKERRALREFAKPRGERNYNLMHGRTIHALERKKLLEGGPRGRRLTRAGRAELRVPDVFAGLVAKRGKPGRARRATEPHALVDGYYFPNLQTSREEPERQRRPDPDRAAAAQEVLQAVWLSERRLDLEYKLGDPPRVREDAEGHLWVAVELHVPALDVDAWLDGTHLDHPDNQGGCGDDDAAG